MNSALFRVCKSLVTVQRAAVKNKERKKNMKRVKKAPVKKKVGKDDKRYRTNGGKGKCREK